MKTPRELLLSHHRAALPKLDIVRRTVLAEHVGDPAASGTPASPGRLQVLWMELIWPCRRAWLSLAAAWLIVLVLHLAAPAREPLSAATVGPAPSSTQLRLALLEQNRLRAELLAGSERPAAPQEESAPPPPRSDHSAHQKPV